MSKKIVKIEWLDSHMQDGWIVKEELEPIKAVNINTVGYLIDQNERNVRVALNVEFDDKGNINQLCEIMTIPKCSILDMKEISS